MLLFKQHPLHVSRPDVRVACSPGCEVHSDQVVEVGMFQLQKQGCARVCRSSSSLEMCRRRVSSRNPAENGELVGNEGQHVLNGESLIEQTNLVNG